MNRSNWDERDIEELVKKLPSMKDQRSARDIYSKIEEQQRRKDMKKPPVFKKWIPTAAIVAAASIFILLSPSIFQNLNSSNELSSGSQDTAMEEASMNDSKSTENSTDESFKSEIQQDSADSMTMLNEPQSEDAAERSISNETSSLSVLEQDLQNYDIYTFGLVSKDAIPVPVSVLVDKRENVDWLETFEQLSTNIPEEKWGFDDMYPIKGDFDWGVDSKEIRLTLDSNHPYSGTSAVEYAFYSMLEYSFQHHDLEQVHIVTENGTAPEFNQFGVLSEIPLNDELSQVYYSYNISGQRYLAPANDTAPTVNEAIRLMKQPPNDFYQSVIPNGVNISVTIEEEQDLVSIIFLNEIKLERYDSQVVLELLEGLLLTAKSYGFDRVQFQNISESQWNGYDLTQRIPVPVGANKKYFINE